MKKVVALLICVLLIAALAIPALAADETPSFTITADKTTAAQGETVTFTITTSNLSEFSIIGIKPRFDAEEFSMVGGTADKDAFVSVEELGPYDFYFPLVGFKPDDGYFAIINFPSKPKPEKLVGTTCVLGTFTLEVTAECGTAVVKVDAFLEGAPISVDPVSITIDGEHTYGDWAHNEESHTRTCAKCGTEETGEHNWGEPTVLQESDCNQYGTAKKVCTDCSYEMEYELELNPDKHVGYESVVTPPTCTEQGYTTYTCICGDSYVADYVDATGHSYGEWSEIKAPTCEEAGEKSHKCSVCGHEESGEIAATGHDYKAVVTAPTCTEQGYTTYTCACGDTYKADYVDAAGHSYGEYVQTKAPACEEAGEKQAECKSCGHVDVQAVAATGHDYGSVVTAPTCTEQGYTTYTCKNANCGHSYVDNYKKATGHSYKKVVTAPTCTEQGYTTHTCSKCGDVKVDTYKNALGHKLGSWKQTVKPTCTEAGEKQRECTRSGCDHVETQVVEAKGHNYKAVVTKPTCTEQGYTTHTCSTCKDSYVDTYVDANGHNYGSWSVSKKATCTTDGLQKRTCKVWSCKHVEEEVIPATGHNYEQKVTEPTCTEQGYTTHTCANCKDSYKDTYVEANGHKYGSWRVTKEATLTSDGEERRDCENCKHYETRVIPMLKHEYDDGVVTAPTCTEQGYTTYTCTKCGAQYVSDYVDATGHAWGKWGQTKAPSCTEKGEERRDCESCDYRETREIPTKAHDYETVVTAPTCTKEGYTTSTCSVCGVSNVGAYVEATGHAWGQWSQTKAPSCTEKGEQRRDCENCDDCETEEIPVIEHSYGENEEKPTCTQPGKASGKCTVCGHEIDEVVIPALGHDHKSSVTKEPSCTEKGVETFTCTRCGDTYTKEIDTLDHVYGKWTNADEENHKRACACGHEETAKHNWDSGFVTKDPTCSTAGEKTFTCKDCKAIRTEEVKPTGEHDSDGDDPVQIKDEKGNVDTKFHAAVCTCGEQHKELHSYDILGEVIKKPTATTKGEQKVSCACGHETIRYLSQDGTLDDEPGMGDITGQVVMTGIAAFSMIAAAAYICIRKRFA